MNQDRDERADDEIRLADILRPLSGRGRHVRNSAIAVGAVTLVIAAVVYATQPTRHTVSLQFRPIFKGAATGTYPNGVPFGPSDIVDESVLDQVYAANGIKDYCAGEDFKAGFTVQMHSPELQFLDLDYRARLSDTRLTAVDRVRIQEEYVNRRLSAQRQYELQFGRWRNCARIPSDLAAKVATDTLERWARDATEKRGVMRIRVAVLSPAMLTEAAKSGENLLVRADMLRRAVRRVIQNIRDVEQIPGAELALGSDRNVSFLEVRAELEDLVQARLDPLVFQASRLVGPASEGWIAQALHTATIEYEVAKKREESFLNALREYSGTRTVPSTDQPAQRSAESQAVTTPIDRSFIDRIVEMSAINAEFRQEVTEEMIAASISVAERQATMEQYRQLTDPRFRGAVGSVTHESTNAALARITEEATQATRRFNEIYDQFSRVALRSEATLYHIEAPPHHSKSITYSLSTLLLLVLLATLLTPVLLAVMIVATYHGRRLLPSPPQTTPPAS